MGKIWFLVKLRRLLGWSTMTVQLFGRYICKHKMHPGVAVHLLCLAQTC